MAVNRLKKQPEQPFTVIYKQYIEGPNCMATAWGRTPDEAFFEWRKVFPTAIKVSFTPGFHPLPK